MKQVVDQIAAKGFSESHLKSFSQWLLPVAGKFDRTGSGDSECGRGCRRVDALPSLGQVAKPLGKHRRILAEIHRITGSSPDQSRGLRNRLRDHRLPGRPL